MALSLSVELNSAKNIILFIFHVCVAVTATFLNVLIILAFLKSNHILKQSRFLYLFHICLSSFFNGAMWFYVGLFDVKDGAQRRDTYFIYPSLTGVSYLLVMASQVDRFCALEYPFHYLQKITLTKTKIVIYICWAWPFINAILVNVLPNNQGLVYLMITTIIFMLVIYPLMVGFNIKLFMIANQQIQNNTGSIKKRLTSNHPVHLTIFVVLSYIVLWFPTLFEFCKCVLVRSCIAFKNQGNNYFSILRVLTTISVPAVSIATSRIIKDSILKIYHGKSRDNR